MLVGRFSPVLHGVECSELQDHWNRTTYTYHAC
jgi:hypothetical protein